MKKLVVITGAGRGLGFALTKRHLITGDEVCAFELDLSDELLILQKYNDRLAVYPCDIGSTESVRNATAELLTAARPIDCLYNIAAIRDRRADGTLTEADLDAGVAMFDINAMGLLRVCKALYPLFDANTRIVNVTDEQGGIGCCRDRRDYPYRMSKAAAHMASKLLSNELSAVGTRVLCYHPGPIRTPLGGQEAARHPFSQSPEEAALTLLSLMEEERPRDQLFIGNRGEILSW